MIRKRIRNRWERFWMGYAGLHPIGRLATRLAEWFAPPYYARYYFAYLSPKGYISTKAIIHCNQLNLGPQVFIGDRVTIFQGIGGGPVELGERVNIYGESYIQTGKGGAVKIGANSQIHPRCQFSAYKARILVGRNVQIAPNCAFYPYNHGVAPGQLIQKQPLESKGDIVIEDDAWLGYGVIVLDGVRIGKGAVIGAGSTVSTNIPDEAIAVGSPARVIRMRRDVR